MSYHMLSMVLNSAHLLLFEKLFGNETVLTVT